MDTSIEDIFRHSMRRFATTVSVITCARGGVRHGMTATAVTALCMEPASLLVCINARASLLTPLLQEGAFCINLLQSNQAGISRLFGGKAKGEARFAEGSWQADEAGIPFLADAQASIFCLVDGVIPYGTHRIIIGRVERGHFSPAFQPLIYQDGTYMTSRSLSAQGVGA
ncbi:flavin reductase family protein [Labrys monachus]|uniref:Flavin reductase (DIM6/NTAB) family NADH-FMN oxidoreductase RutF n=1 Tax=Labrys monachus TaxID=217067 RepID=A0ABU0FJW7_9HYPH|nr:flavin reductase family protein [Labrys monachus]MDQ0394900.1 flavin reductase (DIM6/NTAB) family NADH-FMN oxidoreductase RutF [Labrys monachus]